MIKMNSDSNKNVKIIVFLFILLLSKTNLYSDIIFCSNYDFYEMQIYISDDKGEKIKMISNPFWLVYCSNPYYTKEMNKIFFRGYSNEGYKILEFDTENRKLKTIIHNKDGFCDNPIYIAKNDKLLFINSNDYEDKNQKLYYYDFKIKKSKLLIDMPQCSYPNISSDEEKIVFFSNNDIYITNIDGTNIKKITNDGKIKYNPTFSENGDYIYYIEFDNKKGKIKRINLLTNKTEELGDKEKDYRDLSIFKNSFLGVEHKSIEVSTIYKMDFEKNLETILIENYNYVADPYYTDDNLIEKFKDYDWIEDADEDFTEEERGCF